MVVFVILNYNSFSDTVKCVESIKKLNYKNTKIVIVDNNSATKEEAKNFQKMADIYYQFKENVGFAKGNNKGCLLAKEKFNPDFVCVINSDTEIKQADFIEMIYGDYKKYQFDSLGPKIISPTKLSANPFPVYKTIDEVENQLKYLTKLLKIYQNIFLRSALAVYIKLKRLIKKPRTLENSENIEFNVALHGCFLIFSKQYLEKYQDVFYPQTFLYHEEEFLYYRMQKDNLNFMYDPLLEVYHYEGSSLNKSYQNKYKKLIFKTNEVKKSLELYKEVLKRGEKI